MTNVHLDRIRELFKQKRYTDVIRQWGAETSNSDAFKKAAYAAYTPVAGDVIASTYPKSGYE